MKFQKRMIRVGDMPTEAQRVWVKINKWQSVYTLNRPTISLSCSAKLESSCALRYRTSESILTAVNIPSRRRQRRGDFLLTNNRPLAMDYRR